MNAQETMTKIQAEALTKKSQEVRSLKRHEIGKVLRQGDIYVHCVAEDHKHGTHMKTKQLVRGVTQGSRHIVTGANLLEGTTLPEWAPRAILGPIIRASKRCTVTHPEHAWLSLPAGTYQVTLQRDARTDAAVQD